MLVDFFVPARKGGEEKEAGKGENYSHDSVFLSAAGNRDGEREAMTYIRYGNTMLFLKVFATHIKLSGS